MTARFVARFKAAALAGLALWLFACAGASAAEVIHSFDSTVEVAKDGTLTVIETIKVRAEGNAIRHGIFRDFPLTFTDKDGKLREVSLDIIGISRDGHAEPYHTERTHGIIRIYAGSKDTFVSRGDHVYVYRYSTGRQIRWFDGKPELNWNVTGNFWNFPITHAVYHLHLADGAKPERWTAFTGRLGERGQDWSGRIDSAGVLTVDDHAAAGAGRRPHGGGGYSRRRGRSAEPEHAAVVAIPRQPRLDHRRDRLRHRACLLHGGLERGRPRSQSRRHHSAVSSARGHFAGAGQLHPQLGLGTREVARLHRRRALARRARPADIRPARQDADLAIDRQAARRRLYQPAAGRARDLLLGQRGRTRQYRQRQRRIRRQGRRKLHHQHRKRKPQSLFPPQHRLCRRRRCHDRAGRVRRDRLWRPGGQRPFHHVRARLWRHRDRHVRGAVRAGAVWRRQIREPGAHRDVARLHCRLYLDLLEFRPNDFSGRLGRARCRCCAPISRTIRFPS